MQSTNSYISVLFMLTWIWMESRVRHEAAGNNQFQIFNIKYIDLWNLKLFSYLRPFNI